MTFSIVKVDPLVTAVDFGEFSLKTVLADGREVSVPLEWLPRLRDASDAQRRDWTLIAGGVGIHWNEIDEDVMVEDLLRFSGPGVPAARTAARPKRPMRRPVRKATART